MAHYVLSEIVYLHFNYLKYTLYVSWYLLFTLWQVWLCFALIARRPLPSGTMVNQMISSCDKFLWCQYASFTKFRLLTERNKLISLTL